MILRAAAIALLMTTGWAGAQAAPTLADLRADLTALTQELQSLRAELVASGAQGFQAAGGDTAIDRMNAMEAQLSKLTGQTEQLQNRIRRITDDGTRRIADLEFRLCEMDETCDLGALMSTPELGSLSAGGTISVMPIVPDSNAKTANGGKQPTTAEQQDFDNAQKVLAEGEFEHAAGLFAAVAENHAGGALTAEALFLRGAALDSAGQPDEAAAAWLEAFAAAPNGSQAPDSLLGIARVIAAKDDPVGACLYLAEIPVRFAGSDAATEAQGRMQQLNCGSGEMPSLDPEAAADLTADD